MARANDTSTTTSARTPRPITIGSNARPGVGSNAELGLAKAAATAAALSFDVLDDNVTTPIGRLSISTMHLAKGLEFRAVVGMACDDEVIPLQERLEMVADEGDLEDVYNTERQLLYVACTRARDQIGRGHV